MEQIAERHIQAYTDQIGNMQRLVVVIDCPNQEELQWAAAHIGHPVQPIPDLSAMKEERSRPTDMLWCGNPEALKQKKEAKEKAKEMQGALRKAKTLSETDRRSMYQELFTAANDYDPVEAAKKCEAFYIASSSHPDKDAFDVLQQEVSKIHDALTEANCTAVLLAMQSLSETNMKKIMKQWDVRTFCGKYNTLPDDSKCKTVSYILACLRKDLAVARNNAAKQETQTQ